MPTNSGTELVDIPDVQGQPPEIAQSILVSLGFRVSIQYQKDQHVSTPTVKSTSPPAHFSGIQGQLITLKVGVPTEKESEEEEKEEKEGEERPKTDKEKAEAFEKAQQKSRREAAEGERSLTPGKMVSEAGEAAAGEGAAAGGAAAGGAAAGGAAATSEFWVPALVIILIIVLIVGLVIFIFATLVAGCNQGGLKGTAVRTGSKLGSWIGIIPFDVCEQLGFQGGRSGGGGAGGSFSLDIILTSAYRPESNGSAHQRGEAVDIALRPVPTSNSDPRIAQLFAIGESAGFVPPDGDTIDEWNNPQERTSAGHIHVEFNLKRRGDLSSGSYCPSVEPVTIPPTDLVDIPATIPRSGVTNDRAKVRRCMLDAIQQIFNSAGPPAPPST